ncbi:ribonuclease [Sphingomonas koreensis]|nr:ribonuclease [Sphingomonas koreensis]
MAEWLYEAGIGEARAALVEDGRVRIARIELDSEGPRVGAVVAARLTEITAKGREGVVGLAGGGEALLSPLPTGITQGAALLVEITREAVAERGRAKRAKAAPAADGAVETPGRDLLARITASGVSVHRLLAHQSDDLEAAGWSEVLDEAETGEIAFAGGALRLSLTPAMTLIDVDGQPPLETLAVAAATAAAQAIARHGIGGSIGVDFPTIEGRGPRQAVAAAIDAALPPPFERTAMNGFGFLQIVRRRLRPSLPELLQSDPVAANVRALLRRIERTPPPGERLHRLPRAELALIRARPDWNGELARRTGVATAFVSLAEES